MTDNWDFYFLQVDGKAASIFVDLDAVKFAPNSNTHMSFVRVYMNSPRADGLSSSEEYDSLKAIEHSFEQELVGVGTDYVGRCTKNSCRDFFFYVRRPSEWNSRVAHCMAAFPDYTYDSDTREDPEWSIYKSYLYPSEIDLQTIENRRVCDSLQNQGDKLEAPRDIDHWIYFTDPSKRDAFVLAAAEYGFVVRELTESSNDRRYCAQLWRNGIPSFDLIDDITIPLFKLAIEYGGDYDGWESIVVK